MNNAAPRSVFGLTHGASLSGSRPRHDIEAQEGGGSHHPQGATRPHHPDGAAGHPHAVALRVAYAPRSSARPAGARAGQWHGWATYPRTVVVLASVLTCPSCGAQATRDDAGGCLSVLLHVHRLWCEVEAPEWRLLRVLLLRNGRVPAQASRRGRARCRRSLLLTMPSWSRLPAGAAGRSTLPSGWCTWGTTPRSRCAWDAPGGRPSRRGRSRTDVGPVRWCGPGTGSGPSDAASSIGVGTGTVCSADRSAGSASDSRRRVVATSPPRLTGCGSDGSGTGRSRLSNPIARLSVAGCRTSGTPFVVGVEGDHRDRRS